MLFVSAGRVFLLYSVNYLIGRGTCYCRLIALQPVGTRRSASDKTSICVFDRAKKNIAPYVTGTKGGFDGRLLSQNGQVLYTNV